MRDVGRHQDGLAFPGRYPLAPDGQFGAALDDLAALTRPVGIWARGLAIRVPE